MTDLLYFAAVGALIIFGFWLVMRVGTGANRVRPVRDIPVMTLEVTLEATPLLVPLGGF